MGWTWITRSKRPTRSTQQQIGGLRALGRPKLLPSGKHQIRDAGSSIFGACGKHRCVDRRRLLWREQLVQHRLLILVAPLPVVLYVALRQLLDLDNEMPNILFVPEYTFMDRVNAFRGFLDTNATLYPQLQDIDFRSDVPDLAIPFYMVLGEHEARGRAVLADEWFEMVDAPLKERVVFAAAGHRAHFDRPDEFARLMARVLEETLENAGRPDSS